MDKPITLQEYIEMSNDVDILDQQFTDDIIDNAEYYDIDVDPITTLVKVTLFDVNGGVISSATVNDYDVAMAYLEDVFDLEEYEPSLADDKAAAGNSPFGHAQ